VRNTREAFATAPILGLDPDSVRTSIQTQMAALGGGRGGRGQGGEPAAAPLTQAARGDVALGPQQAGAPAAGQARAQGAGQGGGQGFAGGQGGFQLPDVTDKECDAVTAAMKKKPAEQARLDSLRQQMMSGAIDRDAMRAETQKIYAAMGVDPRVATACRRRAFQGGAGGAGGMGGGFQTAGAGRRRPALVFVKKGETFEPRVVLTGASNFDYTEIVSGVKEGEQVAMLAAAALQAQRQQNNDRIRQNTGVPGMQQGGGAGGPGGGRAGGGGGGGRAGGGGGR